jgi:hypothetical protein
MLDENDLNESNLNYKRQENKVHPWRRCPSGYHFVKEYVKHIAPNKTHPKGLVTTVHEHCAKNPSHKEELSYDEIQYITANHFSSLSGSPTPKLLTAIFKNADNYDLEIRGWVQYWNDIFHPDERLDPNLIKAGKDPIAMKHLREYYQILQQKPDE